MTDHRSCIRNLSSCKKKSCLSSVYNCDDQSFIQKNSIIGSNETNIVLTSLYHNFANLYKCKYYLTNRFHFAVRLYSDNAQMSSKHDKNKAARSVTDVLTMF